MLYVLLTKISLLLLYRHILSHEQLMLNNIQPLSDVIDPILIFSIQFLNIALYLLFQFLTRLYLHISWMFFVVEDVGDLRYDLLISVVDVDGTGDVIAVDFARHYLGLTVTDYPLIDHQIYNPLP